MILNLLINAEAFHHYKFVAASGEVFDADELIAVLENQPGK